MEFTQLPIVRKFTTVAYKINENKSMDFFSRKMITGITNFQTINIPCACQSTILLLPTFLIPLCPATANS